MCGLLNERMNEWMNKVININIYSQTEIIPWVTTEEPENENIMQNDAIQNLESKEGIHKCGIWPELVEFCEKIIM